MTSVSFPLTKWLKQCPDNLPALRAHLAILKKERDPRAILNGLIEILILCKRSTRKEQNDYINALTDNCLKFASMLCDQPHLSYEDLLLVRAKRKISPSYTPNYLPGQEVDCLPIETYASEYVENTPSSVTEDAQLLLKRQRYQRMEKNLRLRHQRKRRVEVLSQALRAPEDNVAFINRPQRLLPLQSLYLFEETLPKHFLEQTPFLTISFATLMSWFGQYEQCYQDELSGDLQPVLQSLDQSLQDMKAIAATLFENKEGLDERQQRYQAIKYLFDAKENLLRLVGEIESALTLDLTGIKGKIKKVIPQEFFQFYLEHSELFSATNTRLHTHYYRTAAEKLRYQLFLIGGKCYRLGEDADGDLRFTLFDTLLEKSHSKPGWVSFVMNSAGEFFASSHLDSGNLHSSFMAGAPVMFAGEMKIGVDGNIEEIFNYSGHYTPLVEDLEQFSRHLQDRRVNMDNVKIHALDAVNLSKKLDEIKESSLSRDEKDRARLKLRCDSEQFRVYCEEFVLRDRHLHVVNKEQRPTSVARVSPLEQREIPPLFNVSTMQRAVIKKENENENSNLLKYGLYGALFLTAALCASTLLLLGGVSIPFVAPLIVKMTMALNAIASVKTTTFVATGLTGAAAALTVEYHKPGFWGKLWSGEFWNTASNPPQNVTKMATESTYRDLQQAKLVTIAQPREQRPTTAPEYQAQDDILKSAQKEIVRPERPADLCRNPMVQSR